MCLKPGKSTGLDRCPNELTKTMTDEKFQLVKMWVKEILTEDTSRQRETMNSTILELHKGGGTNKPSDQRPVVLLNSVYPLLNAFNAMSQAALWQAMRMFKIPDVDSLEQIYEGATVRLAPNDEESATITFNTGVAQGSITSLQLFNIFINALLRMLTITGQNEDISHGLQISKDQKGDNQRNENGINSTT